MRGGCRVVVAALWVAAGDRGIAASNSTHTVTMEGVRFEPPSLTVAVGDTITWTNKDPFPHTVTGASGGFDSKNIDPGKSWRYTPRRVGDFPYVCTLHPTMKGVLHVEKTARKAR